MRNFTKAATLSLIACSVSADGIHDSPQYIMSQSDVTALVSKVLGCCVDTRWAGLEDGSDGIDYRAMNYKFPMGDGSHVYFILDHTGPHTLWYRVFTEADEEYELLAFPRPLFVTGSDELEGIGANSSIFNPTFDPTTGKLTSSDFSAGGDWSVELTYQLINDTSPRFVLVKYQEDTVRDGQVKYDRVHTFGD